MISALLDHLWQSTLCAAIAGLLTLLLRRKSARIRFALWFAASLKFLLPFALLVNLGRALAPLPVAPQLLDSFRVPALLVSQGLTLPLAPGATVPGARSVSWQIPLLAIWSLGVLFAVTCWAVRWWRLRLLVKTSTALPIDAPIPVRSSPGLLEPGLIGILRPTLLLPEGVVEQLVPGELQSILAHELCHLRRRDNLTYTLHLLVQGLFWFYPLLWWLGRQLLAEREQACDEAVLAEGHEPAAYGDTILKVCRHYLAAPTAGAAGVSGGNLQSRIRRIMTWRGVVALHVAQKSLLAVAAVSIVVAPVLLGACTSRSAAHTATSVTIPTAAERARSLYEQTRPQKEVPFNPADFEKFVGYYQSQDLPGIFASIFQAGDHYYSQLTGQPRVEFFPESSTEFFATVVAAQISFVTDPGGEVTAMVIHQNGRLSQWPRVSRSIYEAHAAKLRERIEKNVPDPGTEDSLRRFIASEQRGQPNYEEMTPPIAAENRLEQPGNMQRMQRLGALQSLIFRRIDPVGRDMFDATFEKARVVFTIGPLTASGKVAFRNWRVIAVIGSPSG